MNFDLDFYKGKKVFVTGHTGFKGSWLCKMLANAGAIVTGYSLNPPTIDVVFHIAWQGVSDLDARNEAIQMQNLQSTLDLIDAMHIMRIGCFIGCGSMHEAESLVEMNEDKVISNLGYMYKAMVQLLLEKLKS